MQLDPMSIIVAEETISANATHLVHSMSVKTGDQIHNVMIAIEYSYKPGQIKKIIFIKSSTKYASYCKDNHN